MLWDKECGSTGSNSNQKITIEENYTTYTIKSVFTTDTKPGEYYPVDIAHLMDGIIIRSSAEEMGVRRRYIEAIKVRGSAYTTGKKLMDMTSRGLEISP